MVRTFVAAFIVMASISATCGPSDPNPTPAPSSPTATATPTRTPTIAPSATPEPSATPQPTSPEPEPTKARVLAHFPTPSSDADAMVIGGSIWVDARGAEGEVLAFINGRQCGRGQSVRLNSEPPAPFPTFVMSIASDAQQPGCGVPGSNVTVTLNGRPMNDTIVWQPGFQQPLRLIAGPAFAQYSGKLRLDPGLPPRMYVDAFIGGVLCGGPIYVGLLFEQMVVDYTVVVDPEELRTGCGREGVEVDLIMTVEGQPDVDLGHEVWRPGAFVERPTVDLSGRIPTRPLSP